jgi:hypothetical protein
MGMNEMDMTGFTLRLAYERDVPQLHRLVRLARDEVVPHPHLERGGTPTQ